MQELYVVTIDEEFEELQKGRGPDKKPRKKKGGFVPNPKNSKYLGPDWKPGGKHYTSPEQADKNAAEFSSMFKSQIQDELQKGRGPDKKPRKKKGLIKETPWDRYTAQRNLRSKRFKNKYSWQ